MSKLTFRADDDLVERVERLDASKSEVMREALRSYLERADTSESGSPRGTLDALVEERVDELLEERLAGDRGDVNVTVSLESPGEATVEREAEGVGTESARPSRGPTERGTPEDGAREPPAERTRETTCEQCGESIDRDHVYCPNCGEKRSRRVFCECGDELRTDWSFCPSCGRRTPAAEVLDSS